MTATPDVVTAALAQIEIGFAAFALKANTKVPITEHGFKNATTKPDWLATQLKAPPAGNYGIVWPTDAPPVVVFDLDDGKDGLQPGQETWQNRLLGLMSKHGALPPTKATTTPSGGRHAFYRWPADVPIPPGDDLFGFTVRWPGRGYLVGPGSSIDGRPYVAGRETSIAALPEAWVTAAVAEHPQRPRYDVGGEGFITVTGGYQLPDRIPTGRRYANVRDYVASRYNSGLSPDELWELVKTQVAPRFETPKSLDDLQEDFGKVMAKIVERLGPPAKAARMSPADAVAAVSPIEVRNLADIAVEAVVWLWHRYLPVGSITLFDGNPGEGKSTIVADIIARLTTGGEWPDGTQVGAPGRVLYITKEDDAATQVRPRIEAAGGDARQISFVAADLLFPRDRARFRDLLDETRPRLVMLDPLMSYLEGSVKVISDNEVRSAIMTPLAEIAREMSCVILVIRHFNKGSGQSALMRGAGSLGGLAGAARMVLALTPDPEVDDDKARVFGVVKSNYEAKPPSLKATIESAPVEGFQMTVSKAAWHGESATSVGDLMERTRDEHQLVLEAEDVLREMLEPAGMIVSRTEIFSKMKGKGHSKTAVYNAARALRVVIDRAGFQGGTSWSLPVPLIRLENGTNGTNGAPFNRPIGPDARMNGMNGLSSIRQGLYETPTDGTDGTNDESLHSSHPSHPSIGQESLRPPARGHAPAREADVVPLTVLPGGSMSVRCHFYDDHRFEHRPAPGGGHYCPICYPEDNE